MARNTYEADFIKELERAVSETLSAKQRASIPTFKRQYGTNRIGVDGNTYFQFGDYRLEMEGFTLIVEVESSGGVTNLLKYWYCLAELAGQIKKPLVLLHVYIQSSAHDYESHLKLWDFLSAKMLKSKDIKQELVLKCYRYWTRQDLEKFLNDFKRYLRRK